MNHAKDIKAKTVEDLLADESFLDFCGQTNQLTNIFWKKWIDESEENKKLAEQAMSLLKVIRIEEKPMGFSEIEMELNRLLSKLQQ